MSFSGGAFLQFPPSSFSLRWYHNFLDSIQWNDATWVSVRAGAGTVAVSVPIGFLGAYALTHLVGRLRSILLGILMMPIIVPTILLATGIFYIYARVGLLNSVGGLILAHSALAIPFVVITCMASLAQVDFQLERAARSLGAPLWLAVLTITVPLVRRSLIASALIAFLTSLDDVVIALLITIGEQSTLTRRMFTSIRDQYDPTIAAISTILIVISIMAAFVSSRTAEKS
jgi:putative spermidine/putrescine transport system permease protein